MSLSVRTVSYDTMNNMNRLLARGVVKIYTRIPDTQEYLRVIEFSLKNVENGLIRCLVTGYKLEQLQVLVHEHHKFDLFFL